MHSHNDSWPGEGSGEDSAFINPSDGGEARPSSSGPLPKPAPIYTAPQRGSHPQLPYQHQLYHHPRQPSAIYTAPSSAMGQSKGMTGSVGDLIPVWMTDTLGKKGFETTGTHQS